MVWLVMREVMLPAAIGVAIGLPAALGISRLSRRSFWGGAKRWPDLCLSTAGISAVALQFPRPPRYGHRPHARGTGSKP